MSEKTPEETVAEIMESTRIASMTYLDDQGRLVSTPMGAQKFEYPGTTYWVTERDSDKVAHLRADPRVNVFYAGGDGWVSMAGTATLIEDEAKLKELWGFFTDSFMEGGPEDPNSALLEVTADTAQWWTSPSGPVTMVKLVGAKVSGRQTDLGDTGIVDL